MADTAYIADEPREEDENVDMLIPIGENEDGTTSYLRVPYRRKYHFRVHDNAVIPSADDPETGGGG